VLEWEGETERERERKKVVKKCCLLQELCSVGQQRQHHRHFRQKKRDPERESQSHTSRFSISVWLASQWKPVELQRQEKVFSLVSKWHTRFGLNKTKRIDYSTEEKATGINKFFFSNHICRTKIKKSNNCFKSLMGKNKLWFSLKVDML